MQHSPMFSKFFAPFKAIFIHLSELKFPPGVLLITCATWILPRYAFTVELLRPFLLIAHVVKALAVPKSTGRLLLMFKEWGNWHSNSYKAYEKDEREKRRKLFRKIIENMYMCKTNNE